MRIHPLGLRQPDFLKGRHSREYPWTFDGGATVTASPSPSVVLSPRSSPSVVDPEEAFVASIASCHVRTFLWLASRAGFAMTHSADEAVGFMTKDERGVPRVSTMTLHPQIVWTGAAQERTVTELSASGATKFYRVEITEP